MKATECKRYLRVLVNLSALLVVALLMTGCSNPEKAKAEHLSRGEAFLKEKKFQEASIEFRNALQIDDRLAAAHWGLAQAYEGLERFLEAFEEMKRTIELDANNLEARVRLGNYYLASPNATAEMIAEAERLAKDVVQIDPDHIEGHILMSNVFFRQNNPDQALAEMNRAIEINPQRVETHLSLARLYESLRDAGKAEEAYRRALSINNASSLAHAEYGKFLSRTNRPEMAEAEFKKAVEVDPSNRDARLVLASFYLLNKQMDQAEEAYKAVAELDKDRPEGRAILADFYSTVGRHDDAIKIYQEIASKTPDYTRARYRLGEIMLQRGDLNGASLQIDELTKKNDRDAQALLLRARLNLQKGEPKEAIADLTEVLKQNPNDRAGLYYMAQANFTAGQIEQARTFAGELERFYPNMAEAVLPAKLMQVQISLAANDPKTAQRLANELIDRLAKTSPGGQMTPQLLSELRSKALTARGTAHLMQNDARSARQDLEAARDLEPNAPSSYSNLAAVSLKENKLDEAIALYDRALAIDKTNFDALSGLINNVYNRQNRTDQAHARVDQALGEQSSSKEVRASLHYLKAQIYGYERNAQGAEAELRRALEISEGRYLPAYSALGALYANTNQQERAIAEFRKILEHKPDDVASYTLIGMLESSRENHDAAAESYRKAIELDQNAAIAANNLAWIYATVEGKGYNLDEAVRLAQGVVQRFPDNPSFIDTLGWVYYKKGLYAAAVEQLQRAVNKANAAGGDSATYRYHLAMALAASGDRSKARQELEQALRLGEKGNFAEAEEARKALATL
ncbi:MAG TPA: tetratricopeptide repeat protein [Pyrinomonadaceae bacterium]|nr:tetratricopeptide repeat protein [Pyrinomonadaceae bacterium]